ncbi:nonribosomal peptide synthetase 6 [Trichoderma austrokoningii]
MVAIEMAGGAFVPLDPKAPHDRLSSIIDDVKATIILTSPCCEAHVQTLGLSTLVIDKSLVDALPETISSVQSRANPSNAAVVLFTSGSTGKPKGMVIQHDAICSSANAYGSDLKIGPGSRVFQFSAYTFDVGILDTLVTLMRGGCVCIPSDHDRLNDLTGAINKSQANWIFLTPTVADLLNPVDLATLRIVCLGGEAISQKTAERWKDFAEVHGLYGPAEASICAWNPTLGKLGKSINLGKPLSSAFWVVKPDNISQLVPVGCIGELLIQGPLLARGYINVSKEQATNWIEDLNTSWLPSNYPKRAYRSGDLVRRNGDGTFDYIGRKDTQVKIHGQRVEIGEIESRIHEALPTNMTAMVDLVKTSNDGHDDCLVAFLWYTNHSASDEKFPLQLIDAISEVQQAAISDVEASLASTLPSYMIPSSYLILRYKPEHTTSGKINRRALIEFGHRLSSEERLRFLPGVEGRVAPTIPMELKLRELWAEVLYIDSESISSKDSFLRIGGDSISAIRLTTAAQKHGMSLDVATIFRNPRLRDMANAVMASSDDFYSDDMQPFSMLSNKQKEDVLETLLFKRA